MFCIAVICINQNEIPKALLTHWVIDIEESLAGGKSVVLINLLHTSHSEEHTNRRTKSKENIWLKVQCAVNHRNLPDRNWIYNLSELPAR